MKQFGCAALIAGVATCAAAETYFAPSPGTHFVYGTYEGGDVPYISETITVVASDDRGFVAQIEVLGENAHKSLNRYLYGFTSFSCEYEGMHPFGDGVDALWPYAPGKADEYGAFFVIGPDIDAWVNNTQYDVWAVREVTEHGSTWVTRSAPALGGMKVDDLVGIERRPVPNVDIAAVEACLKN
jgi:hypothetical protein